MYMEQCFLVFCIYSLSTVSVHFCAGDLITCFLVLGFRQSVQHGNLVFAQATYFMMLKTKRFFPDMNSTLGQNHCILNQKRIH